MLWRYADPALDEEAYRYEQDKKQERWEAEHYRGRCIHCGKPMFEGAYDTAENWVYDEDIDDYSHEWCRTLAQEEREEAEEAFDDMMGHPMEMLAML